MREIKFRAWGNRQNKYFNPDDVSISADGFMTMFNVAGKHSKAVQPPGVLSPWFIIEQYTGLKDKNDTEIYEGDICVFKSGKSTYKGVLKWDSSLAGFGLQVFFDKLNRLYTFHELNIMGIDLDMLEVVGNIHENPELLEEK